MNDKKWATTTDWLGSLPASPPDAWKSVEREKKQNQKENKIIDFHLLLLWDRVSWVPPAGFNQTIESCMNYLLEFCTHLKHISHLVPFVRLRCIQRRSLSCTNSCLRWEKCTSKIKKKTSANVRFGNNWFRTETVKLIRVFKVQFIIHWDEIRKFESNSIFSGVKFEFIYMAGIQSVFFAFRPLGSTGKFPSAWHDDERMNAISPH